MPDINVNLNGKIKLLAGLKTRKAPGPDGIKPLVLKELKEQIAPIIQILFQKSLATGAIPKVWTQANVAPLFKKGKREDAANYRPISLTCIICKVMEHIVASNLSEHFRKYDILYDLQHGFREKRSCETQLLHLVDDLAKNMTKGQQTDLILLDFSKASDKVSHQKLLFKLQENGVDEKTISWIKSFLIGRTQKVILNGDSSTEVPVTSGVPQGSVLGPLLFVLYINDLPESVKSQVRLFADDTAVYLTITNKKDCLTLQEDLDKLVAWEKTWEMEFNPSKCQVLSITRKKTKFLFDYKLHGQVLENVDTAKYLGVDITKDLSWNTHINRITANANKTLGFLRRNVLTKNENIRQLAYKTMVRPQLEYASTVWNPYTTKNIEKLEMVQRRAARWVKNNYSRHDSVTKMQAELDWESLQKRRNQTCLIMFYKIYYNLVSVPLPPYLQKPVRTTRQSNPLAFCQIQTSANYFKYSFFPGTIVAWNKLPTAVVMQPSLEGFKASLETHACHQV